MKILLDIREHALIELFRKSTDSTHAIEVEQMNLGDIAILSNDNECLLLIERKTPQDLMSSIKDGRYNEQSFRLQNHTLPNHHIVYLLEGNVYNHRDANTLLSAMFSLTYFKGFSIWQSTNVAMTKHLIVKFANKLEKEKGKLGFYMKIADLQTSKLDTNVDEQISPNNADIQYAQCLKTAKKDHVTRDNIHCIMLSQIPHVSVTTAKHILEKYGTIFQLKKSLMEDEKCLNTLKTTSSTGKERKLSSLVIKNIRHYFDISDSDDKIDTSSLTENIIG